MRVALFGGTFNPIHIGHLIMAQYVLNFSQVQKVVFVPNGHPPHKIEDVADASDRFEMVKISIEDNPYFDISDFEIKKSGPSWTIDTLKYFSSIYERVCFIIGSDNLSEIVNWYKAEEILRRYSLIVLPRERDLCAIKKEIEKLSSKYAQEITLIQMPIVDISSTEIRKLIRQNKSIRYMVHPKVEEYIKRKGLYRR
ncbi:nicotinate (nicotinamide) nucleotide adenylyltransferase [Caldicellulosiruptor obsidiansis OB47]|uniref:Probable nicotinate-nucleotide adenylyltransferase n=1 Tax=Caldicellulosiruptor obsidiansis (strain ATCC BAA-2073 / JCM 16842 / OB47) TaxID=608506 RepID=D9TKR6_CALOO|nr:nicotinate (nicotinamide) nucleotide adenylyltransferase [Caldicellulosiruptor obsidiansis]ADL42598.1 nicotinate (nicotinamide) nucleotide adenylyltransferase [Caldicellulosiruptor obsidiansis OB47]